jgi:RNA 2',3'-cyclic 3'-phosphodiesterase
LKLFFALWPPAEAARALGEWASAVGSRTGGRATTPATIHLTLAFLGEAEPGGALTAARRVHAGSFSLPVDTAKYWRHNRIVWAGPKTTPGPLKQLAQDLRRELLLEKFTLEEREFAAHVTLVRKAAAPDSLPELPAIDWPAREFVLVRSEPRSRYEVIQRFPTHSRS